MKYKSTTTLSSIKGVATKSTLVAAAVLMALAPQSSVFADTFDDRINAIQQQVDGYQQQAASLSAQAQSLQVAIAQLDAQIAAIQAQVNLSQAKYDQLTEQIAANTKKLEAQQKLLSRVLSQLYIDGSTSTVEMLASSENIGQFIDKQEYRSTIRNKALDAIRQIKQIKEQLAKQQEDVKRVLADQQSQKDTVAAKKAEQAKLLADTQGQESAYQQLISNGNSQVASIRAEQAAAYASYTNTHSGVMYGAVGNGGYPDIWANAPQDSLVDDWGMYNRECVSYVAWKVSSVGKYVPYWGNVTANATNWPDLARNAGIPVGGRPAAGSPVGVAVVWQSGQGMGGYGHIAYVDTVNGDGSIEVSQYNVIRGQFNRMHVGAGEAGSLSYIYFQ